MFDTPENPDHKAEESGGKGLGLFGQDRSILGAVGRFAPPLTRPLRGHPHLERFTFGLLAR
jgi:hypothetical protein